MTSRVIWHPQQMQARLRAAQPIAAREWLGLAKNRFPSRSVAETLRADQHGSNRTTIESDDPRVGFIEHGVGAHTIEPHDGQVLKLADGSFVTGPVHHPGMPATPTLRPLLSAWPSIYRRRARTMIRGL